jgi:hypothetical protein
VAEEPDFKPFSLESVNGQTLSDFSQGKIRPNDPRSDLLIRGAVAGIRRHCGWHVSPSRTESVVLDGHGGPVERLPSLHVTEVGEVRDAGAVLTYRADYRWSAMGLLKRTRGSFSPHFRDVEVTFTHGHDDVPDLVGLVHSVVSRAMASPMGATREQAGTMSVSWATTAPGVSGGLVLLASELSMLSTFKL